ncbi:unnamed protein product [Mytilus coruscus]|uniref:Uncharacterized protein n=1 Tax=Mytilus coruscus TaxID=42192 RepID=A0A6J8APF8_MYTCO|nr:unnamed protein product [Mytilus coruscus]
MSINHVKSFEVKDLMTKLLQFFEEKKNKYNRTWYRENPVKRFAYGTGFSEKTIQRHTSSGDHDAVQEVVQSLHEIAVKKQVVVPKKLDDFDECVLRRTLHDLYTKKQVVIMPKLQHALKQKDIDVSLSICIQRRDQREARFCVLATFIPPEDAGSSEQGLIPGCGLIFESKTSSSDYHDEMNKEHFTEWFKDALLQKQPPQSVIVMDNAPYHSHLVPESRKDIIELFNETKSDGKFETNVSREVEEKLWLVDGIRDDENIPYTIDMTEDDNDDSDINDDLDEGEGNDMEIDRDLEYYLSDGINNSDVSKLCDICQAATPPKQKKRDKQVQWFKCVYCKRWLHEKCRKGAARKGDMCPRCHSILRYKNLSTQLLLESMDTET